MSESPWGNEKAKGNTSPFENGTAVRAVILENKTVTPIGEGNQNVGTIADSTIHINPVNQQDPNKELSVIDGIEDWVFDPISTEPFPSSYDKKEDEKRTGSRKKALPLFEPELPSENKDHNSFLPYGDNFNSNNGTAQELQTHGKNPFESMQEASFPSPFIAQTAIPKNHEGQIDAKKTQEASHPQNTHDIGSVTENEQTEGNKETRHEKDLITLIKNTFKRFTHKKKLIERMEEWQPPETVENAVEIISPEIGKDAVISPEKKISAYKNAEPATLEEIRKVIPIEPQNINRESKQAPLEIEPGKASSEVTTELDRKELDSKERTVATLTSKEDSISSKSMGEIRKIREELADSKQDNEELEKNIKGLTTNISGLESSIESLKTDGENLNSIINLRIDESSKKIGFLEERLERFEVTLESIHTDNAELRIGLNAIEQNIAELTGSYGIMLKQMQKLTEFGNSRSAEIFETNKRIDKLDQALLTLDSIQEETQKSMLELRSVTADLIRSVEKTHHANKELRIESENQDQLIKDELLSLTDFVEKEFKNLGARSYRANGENIQLNNIIKNSTNMKLCMEWLEFLMELVGRNNLTEILTYYEELGWISEDVRIELMRYAEGIDFYIEKTDWKLSPDDHVKSIWFIEQLAGLKVDKNRLSIVEKNIKKVKNGSEIYSI